MAAATPSVVGALALVCAAATGNQPFCVRTKKQQVDHSRSRPRVAPVVLVQVPKTSSLLLSMSPSSFTTT
ncbi:hypothetical protein PF001_g32897 [Phytophthora fragariae]|uniref:RxLR effector protein n=1 Tax=Phytophthora fragariae TaxID=53985 RepID=A0A6A4AN16_9STRA|nr:hypothetical protein PF003_g40641 [Phytophthora fragariae]KAE9160226.1 hypothetical protein PF004_g31257 [Phytophthora fragariae]KAE9259898.1 hypothetical protein PF001_g32897 [Phytophthora fragariae]